MNKYDVEHVEKMMNPLSDKINILEHKVNNAEIYAVQELIKNYPKISELSNRIEEIDHELNNIRTAVDGNVDLMKIVLKEIRDIKKLSNFFSDKKKEN